jgi:hypothetical protein
LGIAHARIKKLTRGDSGRSGSRALMQCRPPGEFSLLTRLRLGPVESRTATPDYLFFAYPLSHDACMTEGLQPGDTVARTNPLPISDTCRDAPETIPGFHRRCTRFSG